MICKRVPVDPASPIMPQLVFVISEMIDKLVLDLAAVLKLAVTPVLFCIYNHDSIYSLLLIDCFNTYADT